MGDATNFVVVFAGELLVQAEYLLKMGLHPSEVIEGYDAAVKKTFEILQSKLLLPLLSFVVSFPRFFFLYLHSLAFQTYPFRLFSSSILYPYSTKTK
jgi:hypothetical protein